MKSQQSMGSSPVRRALAHSLALLLLSTLNGQLLTCFAQGSLNPPDPPGPVMKTLDQIEPRIPISSLPYFITNSGSYYLTTNLTGTGTDSGIIIQGNRSDVTVDLNGFALIGGSSSASGFTTIALPGTNIVIFNGTVRNWTTGLDLGGAKRSRFERLQVMENRGSGLGAGDDSIVRQCSVLNNGGTVGISVGLHYRVEDCIVSLNAATGIELNSGSSVSKCTLDANGGVGILASGSDCLISDCHLTGHSLDGIRVPNRCIVMDNFVDGTGDVAGVNACIHATQDSNRIEGNHVMWHQLGIRVDLGSSLIIRNSADFNATNYVINVNNQVGPINAGFGLVTNHPWANFSL